jgi:hypothetical protein
LTAVISLFEVERSAGVFTCIVAVLKLLPPAFEQVSLYTLAPRLGMTDSVLPFMFLLPDHAPEALQALGALLVVQDKVTGF